MTQRERTEPLPRRRRSPSGSATTIFFATVSYSAGAALIKLGRVDEGLQVLDEAMVAVTSGEVSPFFAGVVYCGVIASCEEAFEPRPRAGVDRCAHALV